MPITVTFTRIRDSQGLVADGATTSVTAPSWVAWIPVLTAAVAAIGAIVTASLNWQANLSLEREKLRSLLVQKPPGAGDPAQIAETLRYWGELAKLKD